MGGVTPPGKSHDPWVSHFPLGLSTHSLVSESGFPEVISKKRSLLGVAAEDSNSGRACETL